MSKMYQVVVRHTMDDIPVLLTDSLPVAKKYAATVTPTMDGICVGKACDVLNINATTPVNVSIYTFIDGKLAEWDTVREF